MSNNNDIYQAFYSNAITHEAEIPSIIKIKKIFEQSSQNEFSELVNSILETDNYEILNIFLYYILLFRNFENVQNYINSKNCSTILLEKLLMFTHGYCILYNYTMDQILDEILFFLDNKRLCELILNSKNVSRDKLYLFYILTKFDTIMLDHYFKNINNITEFINNFVRLPDDIMRSIITRNYRLFEYVMTLMKNNYYDKMHSKNFYNKYKDDIDQFSKLSNITQTYKKYTDIAEEAGLPVNRHNMSRISFIVNQIREMPDSYKAIEYFTNEKLIIDEEEKQMISSLIHNPLFQNVFKNYDDMLEIK